MKIKLFLLCILLVLVHINVFSQFGGGDGSANNPYQIWTKEHLEELSDSIQHTIVGNDNWTKDKHFRLMNNIDNVTKGIGIGSDSAGSTENIKNSFQGYFHGGGNTVTLAIDVLPGQFGGLFWEQSGTIDSLIVDGYVKNVSGGEVGIRNSC